MENKYWGLAILMFAAGILVGFVLSNYYLAQIAEQPYGFSPSYGRIGQGVSMMNTGTGMMNSGIGLPSTLSPVATKPMTGFLAQTFPVNITDQQAFNAVKDIMNDGFFGGADFHPGDEIIKFRNGWEIEVLDAQGAVVFEFIVDPSNGNVFPEMGPNMMWNTRFGMGGQGMIGGGMMGQWGRVRAGTPFSISEEQARDIVQDYIEKNNLNADIEEVEIHPGYWEMHLVPDGLLLWQIDVNGYTGAVWLETWHLT